MPAKKVKKFLVEVSLHLHGIPCIGRGTLIGQPLSSARISENNQFATSSDTKA